MTFAQEFILLLEEALGKDGLETALAGLQSDPAVSVRTNPDKISVDELARHLLPFSSEGVPWCPQGLFLSERPSFTLDPLLHAGAYYVQDSSAMMVGEVLRKLLPSIGFPAGERPFRVLDLCAAPGGKTTHAASVLRSFFGNNFLLVSNEVMRQRAAVLCQNVSVWGDPCFAVTSADPSAFASLDSFFDVVIADVPCSGEGMFRKDPEALAQWSADNVDMCCARQKRILADMWSCLRPGGLLIYSTCTFNRKENDGNVLWAASTLGAEVIDLQIEWEGVLGTETGLSLVPGHVRGEGQFCAALRKKTGPLERSSSSGIAFTGKRGAPAKAPQIPSGLSEYITDTCVFRSRGETLVAVPSVISPSVGELSPLHPMMAGTAIGMVKGKDFIPDGDLANSLLLKRGAFPECEVSSDTALSFLHRETLRLQDAPRGIVLLTYGGIPLGFVKNIGTRCNNLLPPSRRIRMDIR